MLAMPDNMYHISDIITVEKMGCEEVCCKITSEILPHKKPIMHHTVCLKFIKCSLLSTQDI